MFLKHEISHDMLHKARQSLLPVVIPLRVIGGIDMLALTAVVAPTEVLAWGHELCGLGEFPSAPIAGYLARSASALYALHGLLVVYMSFDVARYWQLIKVFATVALFHGFVMLGIDLAAGMPIWWTIVEGPAFAATGALILVGQWVSGWRSPEYRGGNDVATAG